MRTYTFFYRGAYGPSDRAEVQFCFPRCRPRVLVIKPQLHTHCHSCRHWAGRSWIDSVPAEIGTYRRRTFNCCTLPRTKSPCSGTLIEPSIRALAPLKPRQRVGDRKTHPRPDVDVVLPHPTPRRHTALKTGYRKQGIITRPPAGRHVYRSAR